MFDYLDYTEDTQSINETVSAKGRKELSTGFNRINVAIIDSRSDIDKYNDLFIDISDLEGLDDSAFERKFFGYCQMVKDRYSKIIFIPVNVWAENTENILDYQNIKDKSALANLLRLLFNRTSKLKNELKDFAFIFSGGNDWFAVVVNELKPSDKQVILNNIKYFLTNRSIRGLTGETNQSSRAVENLSSKTNKKTKDKLVQKVQSAASTSNTEEEAIDKLDQDAEFKKLLEDIEDDEYAGPKISNARAERMTKAQNEFLSSTVQGRSVKDIISTPKKEELPSSVLPVHSINDEWQDMKFVNFGKEYDIDQDIVNIINSFADKDYPVVARNITVEDTSTSLDYVNTYHVDMEDSQGKRFRLTFDIPKFRNNRFLKLRGNEKVISGQLLNLPCIKTDNDTVQLVSNYNKIFISRFGSAGKVFPTSDRLIKAFRKYSGSKLKIVFGDNSRSNAKYNLPIDYMDISASINSIEAGDYIFYFNQDEYKKYNPDYTLGSPIAIYKPDRSILYHNMMQVDGVENNGSLSERLLQEFSLIDSKFLDLYEAQSNSKKYTYSKASIMASHIPLIVVLGITMKFTDILKLAKIRYSIEDKRLKFDPDKKGMIRFSDCYLLYDMTYESSMLMNGLKECDTEAYSFTDMEKKRTWLDFLDNFGGRILADGLENFAQVFLDPITKEVCEDIHIPSEYHALLIYANNLLIDTKYNKHTDITGNRYRTNEIIAGHTYKVLARAYSDYRLSLKRGKAATMSIKRSAVIDDILTNNPVTSDLSAMTPLLELEAGNSATFKGLSGLNTDRAYGLDKRTFDKSMINKLSLSTGFSANIGINRQTTMDMDIHGKRGYIKDSDNEDKSVSKRFSATEAVTPYGATHDDPFRTAMTYIQTSKHSMPTNQSAPLLITNGADEAMAYMVSDTYVFKAKKPGKVLEISPDKYMILAYNDGTNDLVDLTEHSRKNSDGGFYITIKLSTDMKLNQKFKENEIVAYDKSTFSNKVGEADGLAYNVGVLARCAIMTTDEGYEDSTAISQWMSHAMGSSVDAEIPISLDKNVNVYNIVKEGDPIEEGDPLIIFQNAFDDKDANVLLKNITDTDFVSDLGRIRIKAKYTGYVQEIKIYRTCELDEMSESLRKLVSAYEKGIKNWKALYKKYDIPNANTLDPDYKMPQSGILKNTPDGVLIVFKIKYIDLLGIADKLVWQSANKGVIKYIFPKGKEPFTAHAPDKPIHALGSSRSFNARMVTSPIISGALNKMLIALDEQVKEIMDIPVPNIEDIQ